MKYREQYKHKKSMADLQKIEHFIAQRHIAIAGISGNPGKFGNTIFKELKKQGYTLYPISRHLTEFEGVNCYPDVASLPAEVRGIVINTKPEQTEIIVRQAQEKGIRNIWLQQGASNTKIEAELANDNQNVISGQCILMFAHPTHFIHQAHIFIKKLVGSYPK
jgi:predicted CoA-binding protein